MMFWVDPGSSSMMLSYVMFPCSVLTGTWYTANRVVVLDCRSIIYASMGLLLVRALLARVALRYSELSI